MKRILPCLLALLLLAGCLPFEEVVLPVPTLALPAPVVYRTEAAAFGDVVLFRDMRAGFVAAREEILSFPMNGILLDSINIRVGDFVRQGDILIELERSSYLQDLEQIIRDLEIAEVNLRQISETHAIDSRRAGILEIPVDVVGYNRQRDSYIHQINSLNIRKEYLEYEIERRVMRATMDGYITFINAFSIGDVTEADRQMITIADVAETVFMVSGDDANFLHFGDVVEINIRTDVHTGVVINPVEHNITANRRDNEAYIIVQDGYRYGFTTSSFGSIRVIIDYIDEVLRVPAAALNVYGDRAFVFVMLDGLRVIRDVEVGLVGNNFVEILGGLQLGELVIV